MANRRTKRVYKELTNRSKNGTFAEGRLTRDEQLKVIQWCVELKSNYEIADLIKDEFGKVISPMAVWKYRNGKKWKPILARLRERFEKNILRIPIANKVDRLRILQKVVNEGLKWSLKSITQKGDEIYELKLGAVTEAVKAAKDEIEPKKIEHSGEIKTGERTIIILSGESNADPTLRNRFLDKIGNNS